MPLSGEMTTTVSSLTWIFGFTCWHFCYCYLMAPPHLPSEADSQGLLDWSPAVLKDLLNLIPVWRSSSVLAPRFPGESQAGKVESRPPTHTHTQTPPPPPPPPPPLFFLLPSFFFLFFFPPPPPHPPPITAFLIMFPFLLCSLLYPHTPRLLSPLFAVSEPGRSLFSAKWVLFKIMFDALTARTKTV